MNLFSSKIGKVLLVAAITLSLSGMIFVVNVITKSNQTTSSKATDGLSLSGKSDDIFGENRESTNTSGSDDQSSYGMCELRSLNNSCFNIIRCERAGGGSPSDPSTCYRYVIYRCATDTRNHELSPVSRCRSAAQVKAELEKICGCMTPTPSPTSIPVKPSITPAPKICEGQCFYPCQTHADSYSCNQTQNGECTWCASQRKCINNRFVNICDRDGDIIKSRPLDRCDDMP